jgi:hypothetical protein
MDRFTGNGAAIVRMRPTHGTLTRRTGWVAVSGRARVTAEFRIMKGDPRRQELPQPFRLRVRAPRYTDVARSDLATPHAAPCRFREMDAMFLYEHKGLVVIQEGIGPHHYLERLRMHHIASWFLLPNQTYPLSPRDARPVNFSSWTKQHIHFMR